MIQIAPQMRIMAAIEPADFRRGIDGLPRRQAATITALEIRPGTLPPPS